MHPKRHEMGELGCGFTKHTGEVNCALNHTSLPWNSTIPWPSCNLHTLCDGKVVCDKWLLVFDMYIHDMITLSVWASKSIKCGYKFNMYGGPSLNMRVYLNSCPQQ